MAQVIVRNLEERVVRSSRARAALRGRSLEQQLREILTDAARLAPGEKVELSRRARAMTPPGLAQSDSTTLIRQDRDNR
jgi:plasmid stability protein